jgi:predicted nucleic acid-binding protein
MSAAVLVDTSIWVDHFRHHNPVLIDLLAQERVLTHPFVLTELACGTPPAPRKRTLLDLALLRAAEQASQSEVQQFIERERLYGHGCGLVDVTLLASTLMTPGAALWTLIQSLAALARRFGVNYAPTRH